MCLYFCVEPSYSNNTIYVYIECFIVRTYRTQHSGTLLSVYLITSTDYTFYFGFFFVIGNIRICQQRNFPNDHFFRLFQNHRCVYLILFSYYTYVVNSKHTFVTEVSSHVSVLVCSHTTLPILHVLYLNKLYNIGLLSQMLDFNFPSD